MSKINIINIEDSSYDSLLLRVELEESGLEVGEFTRIQTSEELKLALPEQHWDIVICDYYMPWFDAFEALNIIHEQQPKLPFILFSGQANEETAQKVLKAGAIAVINKDRRHLLTKTIEQFAAGKDKPITPFEQNQSSVTELSFQTNTESIGAWEWDIVRDDISWNEQMYAIYGIDKNQFQHDYQSWIQLVHPDDRSLIERTIKYSLHNHKTFSTEFKIIRPDGQIQFISACGLTQCNSAGIPLLMVGTNENITQRRSLEKELYINTLILNDDPACIMVTDANNNIIKVNKNFCNTTGYTEAEVIGKNPSIIQSGRHDETFYQQMWGELLKQGTWKGAIWNKRKNGELYQELLTITAIKNQEKETILYKASFIDINSCEQETKKQFIEFDLLTGLPNRYALKNQLNNIIGDLQEKKQSAALLYIDIDRFQTINNAFSFSIGDQTLKILGQRIQEQLKVTDLASRIGGDEFVVLLNNLDMPQSQSIAVVKKISESIKQAINQPICINDESFNTTCSMGVIIFPDGYLTADNMLSFAQSALHQAKETRDTIQFFSPHMKASLEHKINIEHALHKAIANNELSLHYQPQIRNKRIVSAEALLRWHCKSLGLISPAEFIPLAESTGLIIKIGQWVLEEACRTIKKWEDSGLFDQKFSSIAINVSTLQFRFKHDYADTVIKTIQNANINPEHLKLELTESVLINHNEQDLKTFKKLKDFGLNFAIDDFGTGYCSFNYLYKLPLDLIKIDQSFISNICISEKELGIVKAIIAMSKTLKIDIIAEGVESDQQAGLLNQIGCDYYQGFLFSRPVPTKDFTDLLKRSNVNGLNKAGINLQ